MRKAWVYRITHVSTGRIYIGKSVKPKERWANHKMLAKSSPPRYATHLRGAMNKYGAAEFSFEVIEECESEEAAYEAEVRWIAHYSSNEPQFGFNLEAGGRSQKRGKWPTGRKTRLGFKASPETCAKLKAARALRPPMSEAQKVRQSKASISHWESMDPMTREARGRAVSEGRNKRLEADRLAKYRCG